MQLLCAGSGDRPFLAVRAAHYDPIVLEQANNRCIGAAACRSVAEEWLGHGNVRGCRG